MKEVGLTDSRYGTTYAPRPERMCLICANESCFAGFYPGIR